MHDKGIDFVKIDRKLSLSERKRQVWGWVGNLSVGDTFYGQDVAKALRISPSTTWNHLSGLEEIDLIARISVTEYRNPFPAPFQKLDNPNWVAVGELLIKHGVGISPSE